MQAPVVAVRVEVPVSAVELLGVVRAALVFFLALELFFECLPELVRSLYLDLPSDASVCFAVDQLPAAVRFVLVLQVYSDFYK